MSDDMDLKLRSSHFKIGMHVSTSNNVGKFMKILWYIRTDTKENYHVVEPIKLQA